MSALEKEIKELANGLYCTFGVQGLTTESALFIFSEMLKITDYEQSKWVKFDVDDMSTWPPEHRYEDGSVDCLALTMFGHMFKAYFEHDMQKWWDCKEEEPAYDTIIAWQPLFIGLILSTIVITKLLQYFGAHYEQIDQV